MKLHHSGFVVHDIDSWEKNMVYEEKIADVFDPVQNSRLALYTNYSSSFIELIQPVASTSYSWNSLQKKGNHFSHFCYEVEDDEELSCATSRIRMPKVLGPVPAVLFGDRTVCFYYTRNEQLVEYLINKPSKQ